DEDGGENTQARAVRALVTAAYGLKGALGGTAQEMLSRSWPALEHLTWPRAQAIALVALSERPEHVTPSLRGWSWPSATRATCCTCTTRWLTRAGRGSSRISATATPSYRTA